LYEPFAARADRSAHGELMLTRCSASKKKNAYVGATDDEQRQNRAKEQTECPCEFAEDLFIEGNDGDAAVLRIFLVVFREFVGDGLEFRRRGGKFHAGLEPDEGKPVVVLLAGGYGR